MNLAEVEYNHQHLLPHVNIFLSMLSKYKNLTVKVKESAIAVLACLSEMQEFKQQYNNLRDSAIPTTLMCLRENSTILVLNAVKIIEKISTDVWLRGPIGKEEGSIELLLKLLESSDNEIRTRTGNILVNLSLNDKISLAIRTIGLSNVLNLVQSTDNSFVIAGLHILSNMSPKPDNRIAIREAGGLDIIVKLLENPNVQELAISTLAYLSLNDDETQKILQVNGVVELLTNISNNNVRLKILIQNGLDVITGKSNQFIRPG